MFKQYEKKDTTEIRDYVPDEDMKEIAVDMNLFEPKPGDKIARDPKNIKDQWHMTREYFEENYEEVDVEKEVREFKYNYENVILYNLIKQTLALNTELIKEPKVGKNKPTLHAITMHNPENLIETLVFMPVMSE